MAVILTMTLIEIVSLPEVSWGQAVLAIPAQLAIGAAIGLLFGWLGRILLRRIYIPTAGLYPVLTLALAFLSFGAATMVWGSGFLAVFATGVVLGTGQVPYRNGLARVHDSLAWMSQVGTFLMLGLLVFPSQLVAIAWKGLALAVILALAARPLAVLICLLILARPHIIATMKERDIIQGPTFVVEFLNVQKDSAGNPGNHIHSCWRNLAGDFGLGEK